MGFHAGEVHAVSDDSDDECAHQCAKDFTLTAGQACATHDDCSDDLQFHQRTTLGVAGDMQ